MAKEDMNIGLKIKEAREELGLSQRELARKAQVDNAEISRIEAGKRQKPNVLVLKNIAEVLDLSVVELMKLSGYDDTDINFGRDLEDKRSLRDYKNIIDDYQRFYYDVMEDISRRRKNNFEAKSIIGGLIDKIIYNDNYTKKITLDEILKELQKADNVLEKNMGKLDPDKYPPNDPIISHYRNEDFKKEINKNGITIKMKGWNTNFPTDD